MSRGLLPTAYGKPFRRFSVFNLAVWDEVGTFLLNNQDFSISIGLK